MSGFIISALIIILLTLGFLLHSFRALLVPLNQQLDSMLKMEEKFEYLVEGNTYVTESLIKLEHMGYKEREESPMPTRTKIADLVAENKQLKDEISYLKQDLASDNVLQAENEQLDADNIKLRQRIREQQPDVDLMRQTLNENDRFLDEIRKANRDKVTEIVKNVKSKTTDSD